MTDQLFEVFETYYTQDWGPAAQLRRDFAASRMGRAGLTTVKARVEHTQFGPGFEVMGVTRSRSGHRDLRVTPGGLYVQSQPTVIGSDEWMPR